MSEAARTHRVDARAALSAIGVHRMGRFVSSPRLAVFTLGWIFLLVVAGTLYQASHGAFDAQQTFFYSWIGRFGPVPFPGAQLAFAVLAANLMGSLFLRIRWIPTNAGLIILHAGLLLLLVAGLLSRTNGRTGAVTLVEGHDYVVSEDVRHWDLYMESAGGFTSAPFESLRPGTIVRSPATGLFLRVDQVLPNSSGPPGTDAGTPSAIPIRADADPTRNTPALLLRVSDGRSTLRQAALFGGDEERTRVSTPGRSFTMWLAHATFPLPARLRLVRFRATFYPDSSLPRSFQSTVRLTDERTSREAVISMNHPLRYRGYTFYQSAYGTDDAGHSFSVLQVVRNPGRVLPYLASFVILAGLAAQVLLRRRDE
jgi:ResB-like family